MFELEDLHTLRAVVQAGGVNKAAQLLHRAQSSVTMRIQRLEEKLGVPLFLRQGRGLQLAPAGKVLLEYAQRLLDLAAEAAQAARNDRPRGLLRLGTMESTAAVRLPVPLGRFHQTWPEVALELYCGDPRALSALVLQGQLDAALVADPVADAHLATRAIYEEELVLIAEAAHPRIAAPKDLRASTVLAFHPGCPHRRRLEDWLGRAQLQAARVVEVGSYQLMLGCVAIGMGVALVPRSVLAGHAQRALLSVHPLARKHARVLTHLVWRRNGPMTNIDALSRILLDCKQPQVPLAAAA